MQLASRWEFDPRSVPVLVNQSHMITTAGSGDGSVSPGVQLSLGFVNPPMIDGPVTPETIASLPPLPVVVLGQYFLTADVARGLYATLGQFLAEVDGVRPHGL